MIKWTWTGANLPDTCKLIEANLNLISFHLHCTSMGKNKSVRNIASFPQPMYWLKQCRVGQPTKHNELVNLIHIGGVVINTTRSVV